MNAPRTRTARVRRARPGWREPARGAPGASPVPGTRRRETARTVVDVFAADEQSEEAVDVARWADLARHVLHAQGARDEVEVTLLFVDEPTIAELHERFRGEPGPTDVLAFPVEEEPERGGRYPDEGGTGPGGALPSEEDEIPVLLRSGEPGPTDVLAFPVEEEPERGGRYPDEGGTGPGGALPSEEDEIPVLL